MTQDMESRPIKMICDRQNIPDVRQPRVEFVGLTTIGFTMTGKVHGEYTSTGQKRCKAIKTVGII
jgi:hypothetical protein